MAADVKDASRRLRTGVFVALAAYILLSPLFVQAFGVETKIIRPWIMFKDVGTGILKGEFIATTAAGETYRLSPLDVLGAARYPVRVQPYRFDKLVLKDGDLIRFAAGWCAAHRAEFVDLRYEGRVGAGKSWRPLSASGLCAAAVQ
ncbi:MAG: hypothetical protein HXY21_07420 [Parvularculaceae bacterium]|nr:hypothetical protein [Parvularculaceae bacterium]